MPIRNPLTAVLLLTLAAGRCSDTAGDRPAPPAASLPSSPVTHSTPAAPAVSAPTTQVPPTPPVARRSTGPNDLTGRWKVFARTNEWTIALEPVAGLPNEYAGEGVRDTPSEQGHAVRLKVGALLSQRRLKVWLGPGVIVCDAPYSGTRPMTGQCRVAIGEGAPGPFRMMRVPDTP